MDKDSFLNDLKTQSAILHQLMVMGEGVKRLSTDFRVQHSNQYIRLNQRLSKILAYRHPTQILEYFIHDFNIKSRVGDFNRVQRYLIADLKQA